MIPHSCFTVWIRWTKITVRINMRFKPSRLTTLMRIHVSIFSVQIFNFIRICSFVSFFLFLPLPLFFFLPLSFFLFLLLSFFLFSFLSFFFFFLLAFLLLFCLLLSFFFFQLSIF